MPNEPVLAGVRVLDFGRYIAGPYCASLLGDLGADVIRVEKRGGSEDRFVVPVADEGEPGALYLQVNRNKRGMTLDPMHPAAAPVLERFVASADVVVANLPGKALEAMGLDYESLSAVRPDIILTSLDAFGGRGPWSDRLGFDGVGQAMSGVAYLSGGPSAPAKSSATWVDFSTAAFAALATVAALMERQQSGSGQHVRGSLLSSALTIGNGAILEQAAIRPDRVGTGNRAQVAGPADIFATSDGWIVVQVVGAPLFRRWTRLMSRPELAADPRYATDRDRGTNRDELCAVMAEWCAERTVEQALDELAAAGVPAGPVLSPQEALDHPQVRAGGALHDVAYPGLANPVPIAGFPVEVAGIVDQPGMRAPRLGEHTDQLLAELGFTAREMVELREGGAI